MDIFEAYETDLKLRGAKPESITNYLRVATRWRTWCKDNGLDPLAARKADVQAWLLSTGWAPSTMRQVGLVSLSAAYSYAVDDLEVIDRNPCRKVRLPKPIQRVVRTVPNRVLREIKAHVRDDYDLLLFCLFAYTGCRTVEVVGLTWDKVSLEDNVMLVLGKGDKERLVPLHPELRRCLVRREPITRGSGHVIPGRRGARITHGGLAYQTDGCGAPGASKTTTFGARWPPACGPTTLTLWSETASWAGAEETSSPDTTRQSAPKSCRRRSPSCTWTTRSNTRHIGLRHQRGRFTPTTSTAAFPRVRSSRHLRPCVAGVAIIR